MAISIEIWPSGLRNYTFLGFHLPGESGPSAPPEGLRQAGARGRSGLEVQQVTAVAKEPRPVVMHSSHGLNERVLKGTLHLNIGPDRPNG